MGCTGRAPAPDGTQSARGAFQEKEHCWDPEKTAFNRARRLIEDVESSHAAHLII